MFDDTNIEGWVINFNWLSCVNVTKNMQFFFFQENEHKKDKHDKPCIEVSYTFISWLCFLQNLSDLFNPIRRNFNLIFLQEPVTNSVNKKQQTGTSEYEIVSEIKVLEKRLNL